MDQAIYAGTDFPKTDRSTVDPATRWTSAIRAPMAEYFPREHLDSFDCLRKDEKTPRAADDIQIAEGTSLALEVDDFHRHRAWPRSRICRVWPLVSPLPRARLKTSRAFLVRSSRARVAYLGNCSPRTPVNNLLSWVPARQLPIFDGRTRSRNAPKAQPLRALRDVCEPRTRTEGAALQQTGCAVLCGVDPDDRKPTF